MKACERESYVEHHKFLEVELGVKSVSLVIFIASSNPWPVNRRLSHEK